MAQNFKNTQLVTRMMLKAFMNSLQMGAKVDRQLDSQFRKVGATIEVRRPIMFKATDGAVIASNTDIEEKAASVTLDKRKKVTFAITSQDLTLSVEDFTERYVNPAAAELAQQVETSIAEVYSSIGNFVGTPGSAPSTFLEVGTAAKVLSKLGTPMDVRWCAFYDEDASLALADGLKTVFPTTIATKAIEEAAIGRYSKFDLFENQSLSLHTVGAYGGAPLVDGAAQQTTYDASGDAWSQTFDTKGWTANTSIINKGDVLTFVGVNGVNRKTRQDTGDLQTFTVLDTVTADAGGLKSLTISPPMIISGPYQTVMAAPADGAVAVVKTGNAGTSHKQNLAFHKNAITLAMAPLDMPTEGAVSSRESFGNISIRSVRQYNITTDETTYRFDILYGVKAQNPDFAVRTTS